MSNKEIIVRIKEYLNKLDSADYDNIECWQIMSAFNKAQLDFVRKQLSGYNLRRQGDEASKINNAATAKPKPVDVFTTNSFTPETQTSDDIDLNFDLANL